VTGSGRSVEADVSLIIPSRGRPRLLLDTVRSVLAGDAVPAEIVVVDQSAAPNTEVAGLHGVVYQHSNSVGLSAARNIGIRAARHEILVFLDDDMLVDPGWLEAIVADLRRRGPGWAVTGQVREGAPEQPGAFQMSVLADTTPREFAGRQAQDVLYTGNMAIGRELLERVGEFDERLGAGSSFPGAEDNDFGYRLLGIGARIAYVPAGVQHRAWRPPEEYVRMRWRYGVGQGGFYAKHAIAGDRFVLRRAARHVAHYIRRLPGRSRHEPLRARGDVAFVAGMAVGAGRWALAGRGQDRAPAAGETHVFVIWSRARHAEDAIVADVAARFRLVDSVQVAWSEEHFAQSLTRLYGTALPSGSEKERHGGTGPFLLLVVEVTRPRYARRRTGAGRTLVETSMLEARTRYRSWTGGGYRVHASLTREEAERDLYLLLGRRGGAFGDERTLGDLTRPRRLEADPIGTRGWRSLEELMTALDVTVRRNVVAARPPADVAVEVDDVWWATQIIAGRALGDSLHEVDVGGAPRVVELRQAPEAAEAPPGRWRSWRRRVGSGVIRR